MITLLLAYLVVFPAILLLSPLASGVACVAMLTCTAFLAGLDGMPWTASAHAALAAIHASLLVSVARIDRKHAQRTTS